MKRRAGQVSGAFRMKKYVYSEGKTVRIYGEK